jgi:hypothetical protein
MFAMQLMIMVQSYYYRGSCNEPIMLLFGGFCWKVLRINGNGTTRMIYNGTPVDGECPATVSNDTSIGQSANIIQYNNVMIMLMWDICMEHHHQQRMKQPMLILIHQL